MKKIRFIVNPISGIGKQRLVQQVAAKRLDAQQFDWEIVHTEAAGHAVELSRQAVQDGCDIVVAVGGDGSVNEVGQGLLHAETAMAIIPAGSGNGLARHLQIPIQLNAAMDLLNQHRIKTIDTGRVNDRAFMGVAGIGFDAHIGWEFDKLGTRGFGSYIKLVVREYPRYESRRYALTVDDRTYYRKAFLISFANSSQYGNNATIAPNAKIDDGLLDVCIVRTFPNAVVPGIALRLFSNTMDQSNFIEIVRTSKIIVKNPTGAVHLDGEPTQLEPELHISNVPASLKVVVPA